MQVWRRLRGVAYNVWRRLGEVTYRCRDAKKVAYMCRDGQEEWHTGIETARRSGIQVSETARRGDIQM